ncbi:MAG: hypothetical protein K1060chlam5_00677 [Candidatus Anoxychlamydiales bacterium]|nr:hypothetical protein [Candidatus Anoxychlamydiales bacterium]
MKDTYFFYNTKKHDLISYKKYFENEDIELVFLEEDKKNIDNLSIVLEDYLKKEDIKIVFIKDLEKDLKKIAMENIFLNIKVFSSSKSLNFNKIKDTLLNLHRGACLTSSLYADFGIKAFENIYYNLKNTKKIRLLKNFENKFQDTPAIIVGAGPSLEKNIDLLKSLEDKALILAGGSSLNALSNVKIKPHISASIDKTFSSEKFKKIKNQGSLFFYQNNMNYENFKLIKSNKVLVSDFNAYPLERFIYEKLDVLQESFNGGWTVSTFLINIAKTLSCNPIILIGMDLSYTDKKYIKDVEEEAFKIKKEKTLDINNNEVFIQNDWIEAKLWIEEFKKNNKDILVINSTEGGVGFKNIENINLKEVLKKLKPNPNLNALIEKNIQNTQEIELDRNKLNKIMQSIYKSLINSNKILDEYLQEIEKNIVDFNLIRLSREIIYIYLLDPIWQIWVNIFKKEIKNDNIALLINKILFFKNIINEHLNLLNSIC